MRSGPSSAARLPAPPSPANTLPPPALATQAAKQTAEQAWASVPLEFRPYVPPAGSFLLGVWLTWSVKGRQLRGEREKKRSLQKQVQVLTKERDELASLNHGLEKAGRGPSDAVYGKTIAELSLAASESAKVAAQLSRACYMDSMATDPRVGRAGGRMTTLD